MKKKNYKEIINKIESTRRKNNKNWMDILRLAFKGSAVEASKILSQIYIICPVTCVPTNIHNKAMQI